MWNHITQTLQLVSLARGLMSLWKCATHSSLGNFSCTDEREGERCGDANSVEMARRHRRHGACTARLSLTGLPPPWAFIGGGGGIFQGSGRRLRQTSAFVQHWRVWGSGSSLLVHQPLSLRGGFAYFRVWTDSWGQTAASTQWKATKELISNQLPTCFFPAPFICFECWAG